MEETKIDSTHNRPDGARLILDKVIKVDIIDRLKQLRGEEAWKNNDRNSIAVYKGDHCHMVIGSLHDGATMQHLADADMNVQVIDGMLDAQIDAESIQVAPGEILFIAKGSNYTFTSMAVTGYILSILV